ncbi:MAG: hypothetical protein QG633_186 [Patescibacteria group bacterium]|nr:hypothetical protein [Patescibacteria group bacterium]
MDECFELSEVHRYRIQGYEDTRKQTLWSYKQNRPTLSRRAHLFVVPRRGLEPPSLAAYAPQAYAYTNSATWASGDTIHQKETKEKRPFGRFSFVIQIWFPLSRPLEPRLRGSPFCLQEPVRQCASCASGDGFRELPCRGRGRACCGG